MTESDWLTSTDPAAMLQFLQRGARMVDGEQVGDPPARPSDRKLRLFATACCRHPSVWERLVDDAPCPECRGARGRMNPNGGFREFSGTYPTWEECHHCHGTGRINRSRGAVEVAERFADGEATDEELSQARIDAPASPGSDWGLGDLAWMACSNKPYENGITDFFTQRRHPAEVDPIACAILRDLFDPFRSVSLPVTKRRCPYCDSSGRRHIGGGR